MVATERKSFWSPHPFFRYVCVGCGYRQDDRPAVTPVNTGDTDTKKPPPG
ncbi:hypothetical protein ABIF72_003935 [Bradyrhizobium japonicum]